MKEWQLHITISKNSNLFILPKQVNYGYYGWMGTMPGLLKQNKDKIRNDTLFEKFPLFYPKCKHEVLIEVKNLQVTVIKELKVKV